MTRTAAILTFCALISSHAWPAQRQLESDESGVTAASRRTYSLDARPHINRLDFDFRAGETKAWLTDDGNFHLHGWIRHRGLLCATYTLGVRFGIGAPGCLNVDWISDPVYVTSQYQCNGARVEHDGGDSVPEVGAQIEKVTCAERVVRCKGSCR